jgi:hypothetical protein
MLISPSLDVIRRFLRATCDRVRFPQLKNQLQNAFELFEKKYHVRYGKMKVNLSL